MGRAMNTQITTMKFPDVGSPTVFGADAHAAPFSWIDTLKLPEDRIFSFSPLATFGGVQLLDLPASDVGHRERFNEVFGSMVPPVAPKKK